jgi:hypothetical protein
MQYRPYAQRRRTYYPQKRRISANEALESLRDTADKIRAAADSNSALEMEDAVSLASAATCLDEIAMLGRPLPDEWEMRRNSGILRRVDLALKVYEDALAASDTFEGDLGTYMVYLLPAILKNTFIELDLKDDVENEVFQLFSDMFPKSHPVWEHIRKLGGEYA